MLTALATAVVTRTGGGRGGGRGRSGGFSGSSGSYSGGTSNHWYPVFFYDNHGEPSAWNWVALFFLTLIILVIAIFVIRFIFFPKKPSVTRVRSTRTIQRPVSQRPITPANSPAGTHVRPSTTTLRKKDPFKKSL
jgi:MFS family permease